MPFNQPIFFWLTNGFKWSDFVRNEDVHHATQQPPLSSIVSLFDHIAWMNESTDASRILFEPPSEVWRKPRRRPRNPGCGLLPTTWQTPTLGFRKQERQLRTGSTGGCLRSIAQRTRSGACSYWIGHCLPCGRHCHGLWPWLFWGRHCCGRHCILSFVFVYRRSSVTARHSDGRVPRR